MRRLGSLFALLAALVALPASLYAQGGGTITGRVTGGDTGQPIASATVTVQGTALRGVSDSQGRYSISGVPAGTHTLSASTLGREAASRQVTVTAGGTTTADFTLASRAIALEGLVATATGEEQRQREVGNVVGKVNVAEDVQMASVNDVGQVLQGRTAGVSVLQSSGTSGTGARIRIRGSNSVSLSNDPLWIIDGVRSEAGAAGYGVGGQTASRQLDINPEDIENIEVIKGPAAAALYGTAAANGVIVVTTKKGRAGRTRFTAYSEMGNVEDVSDWPANFNGFCSYQIPGNPSRTNFNFCWIEDYTDPGLLGLDVRLDSIVSFNPLEDPRTTPFETGARRKFGLSASGGNER
ncbi:MAG TPA: TonB-dependent receptor plug domain-containing protein, partial [Longimicrobiaceae bacterium]|nr:TonB-dependent receptor plug domain-containing protein [Longimicrobiaceae bacterium]